MAAAECGGGGNKGPPLTRRELGLDAPPPQGPLAQHHITAFPLDLEDAPKQNPLSHRLWELRGHEGRPLLQGTHAAPALSPEHGARGAGRPPESLLGRRVSTASGPRPVLPGQPCREPEGGGAGGRGRWSFPCSGPPVPSLGHRCPGEVPGL